MPEGFETAPDIVAFGGQLKSTFCLSSRGNAILSQHQGDLESEAVLRDFERNLSLYAQMFAHAPRALAADRHPEYLASKLARERARRDGLPLIEVQHHHAHLATCLAENGRPLHAPPVLGIVLDGLGWGEDEAIWGGELLFGDYRRVRRVGSLKPVAMPGGAQAILEPWRNLYAQLTANRAWSALPAEYSSLELWRFLEEKPIALLDALIRKEINAPKASSCGRLFDAVAAALGICRERQAYEGEAACRLEALIERDSLCGPPESGPYSFARTTPPDDERLFIDPAPMWRELLGDLIARAPPAAIAARFHAGLAEALVAAARELAMGDPRASRRFDTVALSGGCFQNAILFETVSCGLERAGFEVLSHREIPANDGGLALGQAAVAAARLIE
jgi:hydrogenase maturation protein HypF